MLEANIKKNFRFPKFFIQEDLRKVAERIIIAGIQENIENSLSLNETRLPALEPITIRIKASKGYRLEPLIATGKLRSSLYQEDSGKLAVKISIRGDRKRISEILQIDGVGRKKKKFNFFGISTTMELKAMAYMRNKLRQVVKNA